MLSEKILMAFGVANKAHSEQLRKGTDIPYIIHPVGVFDVALRYTRDEDALAACLLHDVLEDVPDKYSEEDMLRDFGERVVAIVKGVSEDKGIRDWRARKEKYLEVLRGGSAESAIVSMADKINNLGDIIRDYNEIRDRVWEKFAVSRDEEIWFYDAVYQIMRERDDVPEGMVRELGRMIGRLKSLEKSYR